MRIRFGKICVFAKSVAVDEPRESDAAYITTLYFVEAARCHSASQNKAMPHKPRIDVKNLPTQSSLLTVTAALGSPGDRVSNDQHQNY